jgi:hypothetical protein
MPIGLSSRPQETAPQPAPWDYRTFEGVRPSTAHGWTPIMMAWRVNRGPTVAPDSGDGSPKVSAGRGLIAPPPPSFRQAVAWRRSKAILGHNPASITMRYARRVTGPLHLRSRSVTSKSARTPGTKGRMSATHPDPSKLKASELNDWWRGLDSNQRRRAPADLQSAPFSHSGTPPHRLRRLDRIRRDCQTTDTAVAHAALTPPGSRRHPC